MIQRESDTAGIPHVILDFVVDIFIRETNPLIMDLDESKFRNDKYFGGLEYEALASMSLVHRTWTITARRGLWRRVVINLDVETVFPRGSQQCLQLRELAIFQQKCHSMDEQKRQAQWQLLIEFLGRTSALRVLIIESSDVPPNGFISGLAKHSLLERLWLIGNMRCCTEEICSTVSQLRRLKSLVLEFLIDGDEFATQPDLPSRLETPPQSLTSFSIGTSSLDIENFMSFLQTRNGFAIHNLTITPDDYVVFGKDSLMNPVFQEALPLVKSLHFQTPYATEEMAAYLEKETLPFLLSKATALQHFMLTVTHAVLTSYLNLPCTVTKLLIHHVENERLREFEKLKDDNIACIVAGLRSPPSTPSVSSSSSSSALPRLCSLTELTLSTSFYGDGMRKNSFARFADSFPQTRAVCQQMGIALSFKFRESQYWGLVAEDAAFVG
ncbi:hypothetical protein DFH11DRAFT_1746194 [Phellopilus nigrolimitatus]|nr:hypothetical protein DFH11DRAFT_1746194 [Phellopilus nigrolimitatus]